MKNASEGIIGGITQTKPDQTKLQRNPVDTS